jgi:TM2 domain-containing membrane protein YozV
MIRLLVFVTLTCFCVNARATIRIISPDQGDTTISVCSTDTIIIVSNAGFSPKSQNQLDMAIRKKDKVMAIVLTLLTGPLGVHRLYLGTKPVVPVVYILTLGGGLGVLPFIDLVVMAFSKDISPFENNEKIFMWVKNKK